MIFFPPRDISFFNSHCGLFVSILPNFAIILPFYFHFSHFLSPFFLFLLHFSPFSLHLFIFFPQMTSADISLPPSGGYFPINRPLCLWYLPRSRPVEQHHLGKALQTPVTCSVKKALFFSVPVPTQLSQFKLGRLSCHVVFFSVCIVIFLYSSLFFFFQAIQHGTGTVTFFI